ncbi:aminotransferase class V-fold PLP-dependent enzyme [Methanocalculus sp.]|uniref:aminotransferase class V-fold PLP-dependent enzyme n=1 Tax=Methanocalculus sp. TaxID=2004547 RepID=UPI0027234E6A|nr:aminotransferase class V-fold PLP-dependent enzyme [Methanocalculus sp.]MDO8842625.1 aminotransferase class V-fold PLP-dependent enzyme [Methanocalculus sp.]
MPDGRSSSPETKKPLIYLNNAATSWPKPPGVIAAIQQSLSLPVFGSGRTTGTQGEDYISLAREKIAAFLGAEPPEHIVFSAHATDSLNILISGFIQKFYTEQQTSGSDSGCHVLTTALDHNSVLRPLHELKKRHSSSGFQLEIISFDDQCSIRPEMIEAAIRPDTRLMVLSHGSNVLGSLQDIHSIGKILHDHGIFFIVDGAQTAGHIKINLSDLPVDAFVFTGHKALLGLPGTGGFYLRDPERIAPVRFGGTGTSSFSLDHPPEMPERFEIGTQNYPGLAALAAGVAFIEEKGLSAIEEQSMRQTSFIIRELCKEPNITIYNKHPDLPVIAFNINGLANDDVGFILARGYNIIARTGLHCAPLVHNEIDGGKGCVRLSLSVFTTDEECRVAAEAIREIARHANRPVSTA